MVVLQASSTVVIAMAGLLSRMGARPVNARSLRSRLVRHQAEVNTAGGFV